MYYTNPFREVLFLENIHNRLSKKKIYFGQYVFIFTLPKLFFKNIDSYMSSTIHKKKIEPLPVYTGILGWVKDTDEKSGLPFYWNAGTEQCSWDIPSDLKKYQEEQKTSDKWIDMVGPEEEYADLDEDNEVMTQDDDDDEM